MIEVDKSYPIPYPAFAIAAGPFVHALAKRLGLGIVGSALVVALVVGLLAAALSSVPVRRTRRIGVVLASGALAAAAASLAAGLIPS